MRRRCGTVIAVVWAKGEHDDDDDRGDGRDNPDTTAHEAVFRLMSSSEQTLQHDVPSPCLAQMVVTHASYLEGANRFGCDIGTLKSKMNR